MHPSLFLVTIFIIMGVATVPGNDFKSSQLNYTRVKDAYEKKGSLVSRLLEAKSINTLDLNIYIRAFKEEEELEIWGKNRQDERFQLIKTYKICYASGRLGPKRRQGDSQVPEGFYHIDRFNPQSSFHLSLGINYPNASDKILSDKDSPGGDIFIHGNCVSIGCLAMTDDFIREIYILAIEARNNGQSRIPVTLFPFRMNDSQYSALIDKYPPETANLWEDLKKAFDNFEKSKSLPNIVFLTNGRHRIS